MNYMTEDELSTVKALLDDLNHDKYVDGANITASITLHDTNGEALGGIEYLGHIGAYVYYPKGAS